eukprot:CFRG5369T1
MPEKSHPRQSHGVRRRLQPVVYGIEDSLSGLTKMDFDVTSINSPTPVDTVKATILTDDMRATVEQVRSAPLRSQTKMNLQQLQTNQEESKFANTHRSFGSSKESEGLNMGGLVLPRENVGIPSPITDSSSSRMNSEGNSLVNGDLNNMSQNLGPATQAQRSLSNAQLQQQQQQQQQQLFIQTLQMYQSIQAQSVVDANMSMGMNAVAPPSLPALNALYRPSNPNSLIPDASAQAATDPYHDQHNQLRTIMQQQHILHQLQLQLQSNARTQPHVQQSTPSCVPISSPLNMQALPRQQQRMLMQMQMQVQAQHRALQQCQSNAQINKNEGRVPASSTRPSAPTPTDTETHHQSNIHITEDTNTDNKSDSKSHAHIESSPAESQSWLNTALKEESMAKSPEDSPRLLFPTTYHLQMKKSKQKPNVRSTNSYTSLHPATTSSSSSIKQISIQHQDSYPKQVDSKSSHQQRQQNNSSEQYLNPEGNNSEQLHQKDQSQPTSDMVQMLSPFSNSNTSQNEDEEMEAVASLSSTSVTETRTTHQGLVSASTSAAMPSSASPVTMLVSPGSDPIISMLPQTDVKPTIRHTKNEPYATDLLMNNNDNVSGNTCTELIPDKNIFKFSNAPAFNLDYNRQQNQPSLDTSKCVDVTSGSYIGVMPSPSPSVSPSTIPPTATGPHPTNSINNHSQANGTHTQQIATSFSATLGSVPSTHMMLYPRRASMFQTDSKACFPSPMPSTIHPAGTGHPFMFNTPASRVDVNLSRKSRIKKESHNAIERKRRYHINDRIKELSEMLPALESQPKSKQCKGSTLKRSIDYIRYLESNVQYLRDQLEMVGIQPQEKKHESFEGGDDDDMVGVD